MDWCQTPYFKYVFIWIRNEMVYEKIHTSYIIDNIKIIYSRIRLELERKYNFYCLINNEHFTH